MRYFTGENPRVIDARNSGAYAGCRENSAGGGNHGVGHYVMRWLAAGLRRTAVISFAVVVTAACAIPDRRDDTQSARQRTTCNVAGQFCNTFFGP
ncbi:hypothetical protein [Paraburkholderia sp.]|uniref:hypothetical protein n=1 Tax=Paraburkholderia sp. TaxID=1926495 RepID=UPI0039E28F12